jgi:hypothetical protein
LKGSTTQILMFDYFSKGRTKELRYAIN